MFCVKGCCKRTARHSTGKLSVEISTFPFLEVPGQADANPVPVPARLAQAYADMTARVHWPARPPQLEFYDNLHGVGGLFIPGDWVIAVGMADIDAVTDALIAKHGQHIITLAYEQGQRARQRVTTPREVIRGAVIGRLMAHELGHALLALGYHNPHGPDGEAGADYWAGRFDGARQKDWRMGQLVFAAIGCTGSTCTHPSPVERPAIYTTGYNDQLRAA